MVELEILLEKYERIQAENKRLRMQREDIKAELESKIRALSSAKR
jgi:hypothetical protein